MPLVPEQPNVGKMAVHRRLIDSDKAESEEIRPAVAATGVKRRIGAALDTARIQRIGRLYFLYTVSGGLIPVIVTGAAKIVGGTAAGTAIFAAVEGFWDGLVGNPRDTDE